MPRYPKAGLGDMLKSVYDSDVDGRIEKNALEITLDKLLKGAGAGADPTEIDVPVGVTRIRKTADEDVTNSTTLQNDDHLLLAVGANEVWELLLVVRATAASAIPDFKYAWAVPTGGAIKAMRNFGAATTEVDGTAAVTGIALDATGIKYILEKCLYIGGVNPGNVNFQWAQNTSSADYTRVVMNSYIIPIKLM